MKIVSIEEGKATSPKRVAEGLLENIEDIQHVVVLYKTKNGIIDFGWSDMDYSLKVFMLQCCIHETMEDSRT